MGNSARYSNSYLNIVKPTASSRRLGLFFKIYHPRAGCWVSARKAKHDPRKLPVCMDHTPQAAFVIAYVCVILSTGENHEHLCNHIRHWSV
jgi:hypothetical protein